MSDDGPSQEELDAAMEEASAAFAAAMPAIPAGGRPASRLGDLHICPMVTVLVPHVGGPILPPCVPTVLIGGMPAAPGLGNPVTCAGPPDATMTGSTTVFVGGRPLVRLGDTTVHGGIITTGLPTCLVGG